MMKRQTTKRSRTLEEKASYIKPDNPVERTVYDELVKMGFKESCMGTIYLKDVVSSLTVLMFKYEIKQDKYLSVINAVADKFGNIPFQFLDKCGAIKTDMQTAISINRHIPLPNEN